MDLPELFKTKRPRYIGPDGKRCKKTDPGAERVVDVSADWYADLPVIETAAERIERRKTGGSKPKRQRIKLCSNKRAAKEMLRSLVDAAERKAAGLVDYQTQTNQSTGDAVDAYRAHLTAKGNTADYVELTIARIEAVFDGCQFLRLVDLDADKASIWLHEQRQAQSAKVWKARGTAKTYKEIADRFGVAERTVTYWRQQGAPIKPRSKNRLAAIADWLNNRESTASMAAATSNHYVTALRGMGRWLVKTKRVDANPFEHLDKLKTDDDLRKRRRVLTSSDFARLIQAAENSPRLFRGLSGSDRAMVYMVAAYTGLRASEIGSLKTSSFDLVGRPATVTVASGYTKNGETAIQPLRSDLVGRLATYLQQRQPATLSIKRESPTVWPGTWSDAGAEMIRIDLDAAGIPYSDDEGNDYDFHALRHQFITELARAGVSLRSAQELARHSRPELTANIYTHLSIKDTAADVERMTPLPGPAESFGQAVGQAGFANQDTLRHKRDSGENGPRNKKSPGKPMFPGFFESDADGTRTRNHRIDSPVL